jgi:hypothetical protein
LHYSSKIKRQAWVIGRRAAENFQRRLGRRPFALFHLLGSASAK